MKSYKITVNGVAYNVTVEESSSAPATATRAPAVVSAPAPATENAAPSGNITVESPMPGNILEIKVSEGAKVKTGESLIILEAMKMENEIVAPSDGTVVTVNVRKGDTVEAGQLLITLN